MWRVHQIWTVGSPLTDTVDRTNGRSRDFEKCYPSMENGAAFLT